MSAAEAMPRSIAAASQPGDAPITLAAAEYATNQRFAVSARDGWLRVRREVFDQWTGQWTPRRAGISLSPAALRALATAIVTAGRALVQAGVLEPIAKPLPGPAANADHPSRACAICEASLASARADARFCSAACRAKGHRRTNRGLAARPKRAETNAAPK